MHIIKDNQVKAVVVVPQNATPREKFAAEEFVFYIEKISGQTLCIVNDTAAESENKIIIGGPKRNECAKKYINAEDFGNAVPGPEGFMILCEENSLILAGSTGTETETETETDFERGTIYAVYEFLERYLGCSLAAYCNSKISAGEFIPSTDEIEIPLTKFIKKCSDVKYRTAIVQYGSWAGNPNHPLNFKFISWLAKNRYNRIFTWASIYEGFKKNGMVEEAEKRGIVFTVGHHEATKLFLPPEGNPYFPTPYYKLYPEYYKLMPDGSRYFMKPEDFCGQLILCMRNEDCIRTVADNIVAWAEENPYVDAVSLWPNDGEAAQCCCESCSKHGKTDNYTYFVNRVARLVGEKKPNLKIDQIAYVDLIRCNEKIKLTPSVIIDEAVWYSDGLRTVGKPDGSCLCGTKYEADLLQWKTYGAAVVYYDYFMGAYGAKQKWMPMADEIQAMCRRFAEKEIYGLGTQMECFNLWNNIFNFYTYGRTAYDTELSMEDNLHMFCKIFGKGADSVGRIIRYGEDLLDGQVSIMQAGTYLMRHIDGEKVYELFEKAFNEADSAFSRNNIRMMRMVFRYSEMGTRYQKEDVPNGANLLNCGEEAAELFYASKNFDSYISGKEGFGIAVPVIEASSEYVPDKWYLFE